MEFFQENLQALATTLAGVGAANWLSIEALGLDLVQVLSMGNGLAASSIYVLAGIAGVGTIVAGVSMFEMPDY